MKNRVLKYFLLASLVVFWGCSDDGDDTAPVTAPTEADAAFTFAPSAENDNIIEFTATKEGLLYSWDFGNGTSASERTGTATYPSAGTYQVTLTVRNQEGSASNSQDVVIAQTDAGLLDNPLYNLLTGGADNGGSKTWAIDSASAVHFGVGPNPVSEANGDFPEFYQASANDKGGNGMYDDRYTFNIEGFGFDMQTNGDVFINANQAPNFPGAVQTPIDDDYTAPFTPTGALTWTIIATSDADTTLAVSGDSFLGYYTGTNIYKIITLAENELFLSYEDANEPALLWYLRLVPVGFNSNPDGEPPVVKATLPLGFETQTPTLSSFEGNVATIIDNPDPSGINASAKVLELLKGFQGFSGSLFDLEEALAIQEGSTITLKVWAPEIGVFRFKIENSSNNGEFVEVDANVTAAEEWIELTFDVSGGVGLPLDRVVLFPSWEVANGGTFYVDDISFDQ
jgi:PKD repeat protein